MNDLTNRSSKVLNLFNIVFQPTLPRKSTVTIYKSFIRPHLDYGEFVYERPNESFQQSFESLQYSAAIAIAEAIRGTSSEKLFQELGLETLKSTRWLRKLCLFYKLITEKSPACLFQLIPENNTAYTTKSVQEVRSLFLKPKQTSSKIIYLLQL